MKKAKQIAAIIAVVLLLGLYITTLLVGLLSPVGHTTLFGICLFGTIAIPILAFLFIWIFGRATGKKVIGDPEESADAFSDNLENVSADDKTDSTEES